MCTKSFATGTGNRWWRIWRYDWIRCNGINTAKIKFNNNEIDGIIKNSQNAIENENEKPDEEEQIFKLASISMIVNSIKDAIEEAVLQIQSWPGVFVLNTIAKVPFERT